MIRLPHSAPQGRAGGVLGENSANLGVTSDLGLEANCKLGRFGMHGGAWGSLEGAPMPAGPGPRAPGPRASGPRAPGPLARGRSPSNAWLGLRHPWFQTQDWAAREMVIGVFPGVEITEEFSIESPSHDGGPEAGTRGPVGS